VHRPPFVAPSCRPRRCGASRPVRVRAEVKGRRERAPVRWLSPSAQRLLRHPRHPSGRASVPRRLGRPRRSAVAGAASMLTAARERNGGARSRRLVARAFAARACVRRAFLRERPAGRRARRGCGRRPSRPRRPSPRRGEGGGGWPACHRHLHAQRGSASRGRRRRRRLRRARPRLCHPHQSQPRPCGGNR